jgi:hypothetical protein
VTGFISLLLALQLVLEPMAQATQALNISIGGAASLTLFDQAGVDAPEDVYPEELLALAGLQLLSGDLANEYFYDKQVQLSPAFKALVGVALSFSGVGAAAASALGATGSVASGVGVIPPFLTGCIRRIYAAIFSFCAGVMPPMPMFGRSLL